ncbi:putative O-methyltransferase [Fonsecaea pedrosoi]|nr:putative O-methyltransferase [Fonsecaea pedrosoi]
MASSDNEVGLLENLAQRTQAAAAQITRFLSESHTNSQVGDGQPGSFDIPLSAPPEINAAKASLLESTMLMQQLVMSATDVQQQMTLYTQQMAAIRWICRFDVATHVPPSGTVSYETLAATAHVPQGELMRISRMAMTAGFFQEPVQGRIGHTPTSRDLSSSSPVHDTFLFMSETGHSIVSKMPEMTEANLKLGPGAKPKTAFNIAMNTDMPFFKYIMSNPTLAKQQAAHMKTIVAAEESHIRHTVSGYDWGSLPQGAKIVDLGGSTGHVSIAIARAVPHLKFVVQDLPQVLSQRPSVPADLGDRVVFEAHDFFQPQPASCQGADVFFIRQCLQNWSDADATKILRTLLPAMDRGRSRIVVMSVVLASPSDAVVGQREKGISRMRDLFMMQAMGGGERDLAQWNAIVNEADPGLDIVRVNKPHGSVLSVLDVRFRN